MENHYNNRAYIVALEILFLNKIYKLRCSSLSKDVEQIERLARGCQLEIERYIESNYILFETQNTRLNSLISLLNFSLELKSILLGSKNIFEFNIMIFKTSIENKIIASKIRNFLFKIPLDNKIWLLQEDNPIIHHNVQVSVINKGLQEVISTNQEHGEQNFLEKCQEDVLFYPIFRETLNKAIQNSNIHTIGVIGQPGAGKTAFLKRMCQTEARNCIYLIAHSQYQEPSYPFIMMLYQIHQYFISYFNDSYREKIDNLVRQIKLTNMFNYIQIKFDICDVIQSLISQISIIIICDNLDSWPTESIQLLQYIYQKLVDSGAKFKLICSITGVYYPIEIDEVVHCSEKYKKISSNPIKRSKQGLSSTLFSEEHCHFLAKEVLQSTLPSQRIDVAKYSDFSSLLTDGLKTQELVILSVIQQYPYIFNRDILVKIFQNSVVYEIIDYLLDYYLLLEIDDHFGKHLFCTIRNKVYPIGFEISESIQENIATIFNDNISYDKIDLYSLYILSKNNIFLYKIIDYHLYKMLDSGFILIVSLFINSDIFNNYYPAIKIWHSIYQKNRLELLDLEENLNVYKINLENIRFLLPLSQYYFEIGNYDKSMIINKESIYIFNNDLKYQMYIDKVFSIQSRIFISRCMFKEAIEYIDIGLNLLYNKRSVLFYQFIYLKILCLFFNKDLHLAITIIEKYDFDELLKLYGKFEFYLEMNLLIMRVYFEIGQYLSAKDILVSILPLAEYYSLSSYYYSIRCWISRISFYIGDFYQGVQFLENIPESEEMLYFLSEGYYFHDEKEKALRYIMHALKLSLRKSNERKVVGNKKFDNVYSLQEGSLLFFNGRKDPLLNNIQGMTAYLHTLYGKSEISEKILQRIIQRPSSEFSPFQHIFYYFYYSYLKKYSSNINREDMLYLSYAVSILQNESSKILNTKIRHNYIYNNYWNNLLAIEGEQHNLLIFGSSRNYNNH